MLLENNGENLSPALEAEGLDCLQDYLKRSETLLEYGMGGSTVLAADILGIKKIVSVDTHPKWVEKVTLALSARGTLAKATLLYCDVGEVGHLGKPLNTSKVRNWPSYSTMPWKFFGKGSPDCVFVDGRFRVASFVASILLSRTATHVLFDDYVGRQEYHVIEKFISPVEFAGRLAVFKVPRHFDRIAALDCLQSHSLSIR
jgi:predicted RNA methylase